MPRVSPLRLGVALALAACADRDGDGFRSTDCDDVDPTVHPGATEVCDDGVDQDCDPATRCGWPATASADDLVTDTHDASALDGCYRITVVDGGVGCQRFLAPGTKHWRLDRYALPDLAWLGAAEISPELTGQGDTEGTTYPAPYAMAGRWAIVKMLGEGGPVLYVYDLGTGAVTTKESGRMNGIPAMFADGEGLTLVELPERGSNGYPVEWRCTPGDGCAVQGTWPRSDYVLGALTGGWPVQMSGDPLGVVGILGGRSGWWWADRRDGQQSVRAAGKQNLRDVGWTFAVWDDGAGRVWGVGYGSFSYAPGEDTPEGGAVVLLDLIGWPDDARDVPVGADAWPWGTAGFPDADRDGVRDLFQAVWSERPHLAGFRGDRVADEGFTWTDPDWDWGLPPEVDPWIFDWDGDGDEDVVLFERDAPNRVRVIANRGT